ncbi:MAG TPA: efflux RND transporter periplasmic adaptor subunit [Beijerinckiaceae bacterium]|nr:efflux RND transporter periplasmic adaptor subunit [Beijerinckiaceae bacterium]
MSEPSASLWPTAALTIASLLVVTQLVPALWTDEPPPPVRQVQTRKAVPQSARQDPVKSSSGADDAIITGSLPSGRVLTAADSGRMARAVIKAEQTVAISAELNARIVKMPFKEGDRFRAGAVLVEFDCQRIKAELAAAAAANKLHRNAVETVSELHRLGSAGRFNLRQAQFEMEKSAAEVDNLKAKQATCTIRAPFDGSIAERLAAAHEVVSPNQPLLRIVDKGEPEVQMIVPSAWLAWLVTGSVLDVEVDETRRRYPAKVQHISGAVDPVSQTVRVIARLDGQPADVVPGMSGTARFGSAQPAAPADRVSGGKR